jgi:hypothetical protein
MRWRWIRDRKGKLLVATPIDFTKPFGFPMLGNVLSQLFLEGMIPLGFPPDFVKLTNDLHTDAS